MLRPVGHRFFTVSFSGAGHLLAYHLGVAKVLLRRKQPIGAVAGSSSGAIAAAILSLFPHRLEEFTDSFLQDRGLALSSFQSILEEESRKCGDVTSPDTERPMLVVAATHCKDASTKLFTFSGRNDDKHEYILRAIKASCTIPVSFHPFDMFGKSALSYADEEGIEIDGSFFVDGGISAPAPPTPLDSEAAARIVVSPISGSSLAAEGVPATSVLMINPVDQSFALPGGDWTARCGSFRIRPSLQNLRTMVTSLGVAPIGVLDDWHRRGVEDADAIVSSWESQNDAVERG